MVVLTPFTGKETKGQGGIITELGSHRCQVAEPAFIHESVSDEKLQHIFFQLLSFPI